MDTKDSKDRNPNGTYKEGNEISGRPLKYQSPEELQILIDKYFEGCVPNTKIPPTVTGLGRSLGLDRRQLIEYSKKEPFYNAIKEAKLKIEEFLEMRLYGRTVAGVIFNLKNNYGWKDIAQHEITGKEGGPVEIRNVRTTFANRIAGIVARRGKEESTG